MVDRQPRKAPTEKNLLEDGLASSMTKEGLRSFLAEVREIAAERHEVLRVLRDALEPGNEQEALRLARQLDGLPERRDEAR